MLLAPFAGIPGHLEVPCITVLQPLGEHRVHLLVHCIQEADRGCGWRVELDGVLFVFDEVEVVTPNRDRLSALEGAFAHCTDSEARRQCEALLDACQADVQAPTVEVDGRAGHTRYGVDHDDDFRVLLTHQLGDLGHRPEDASRGFVVGEAQGVVFTCCQGFVHELRSNRHPGLDLDFSGLNAAGLGNFKPAPGKLAVEGVEHLLPNAIPDCTFHDACGSRSEEKHAPAGVQEGLDLRFNTLMQLSVGRRTVADHRGGHGLQDLFPHFCWARDEQLLVHCHVSL